MDIWDFEVPIGTPLKYSTNIGNYCINQMKNDTPANLFVETELLNNDYWNIPRTIKNCESIYNNIDYSEIPNFENNNNNYYNQDYIYQHNHLPNTSNNYIHYKNKPTNKTLSQNVIPQYFDIPPDSNFFIIKSFTLDHIQRAYSHNIWSSTHIGNKKLSECFKSGKSDSKIFLFFSVNGSGKFCGVAEMISDLSRDLDNSIWDNNSKYGSAFKIKWLCVRDIENKLFKHLIVPSNQNKPVTKSRDCQILPKEVGISMLNIFQSKHIKMSSFLDE